MSPRRVAPLERGISHRESHTVTLSPLEPVPASGPGALDGYGYRCTCGTRGASSLQGLARADRFAHAVWHTGRGDTVKGVES